MQASLDRIELTQHSILRRLLEIQQGAERMSSSITANLASLTSEVAETTTVVESAKAAFIGLAEQLRAAQEAALAAGATPEQLTEFTALTQALSDKTDELAAAIPAGTPAEGQAVADA